MGKDDRSAEDRRSSAPFNPFASPVAPEVPAPAPVARTEPEAELVEEVEPDTAQPAAPVAAVPSEPELLPSDRPRLRLRASGRPGTRAPAPLPTEPPPMQPDGPLQTGAERPDLAVPVSPGGRRGRPTRWGGRRPYAGEVPRSQEAWWTTAPPAPPATAPPMDSPPRQAPVSGERIQSAGPWGVVDTGSSVEVTGTGGPSARSVVGVTIAGGAALVLTPLFGAGAFYVVFLAAGAWLLLGNAGRVARGRRPFLRADQHGLQVRDPGLRGGFVSVPWDEVAEIRSAVPLSIGSRSWPRPENWRVVTRDGRQLRVDALTMEQSWNPYRALRQIMIGVALFPLRFGRPALMIDGRPGPPPPSAPPPPPGPAVVTGPFDQLPPPPDPALGSDGNENVF